MLNIIKPVIILGAPRSGANLLFDLLGSSKYLWSLYREGSDIWNNFYKFKKMELNNDLLTDENLDEESKVFINSEFHKYSINNDLLAYIIQNHLYPNENMHGILNFVYKSNLFYKKLFAREYRLVEETPANCFRVSFLNKLFNDCKFIFFKRDGRANVYSLIEGWQARHRHIRLKSPPVKVKIDGYDGSSWKFVLPPGWEEYANKSLPEVAAFQWITSNSYALEALKEIPEDRKIIISYEEFNDKTFEVTKKLTHFMDIHFSKNLRDLSRGYEKANVSSSKKEKWKKNKEVIEDVLPMIEPMMKKLGYSSGN